MKGRIYIASVFRSLRQTGCVVHGEVDNDPHIWNEPYTWGICRPDLRNNIDVGDYVFFVLGNKADLPQMIFAYIKVREIITHEEAYKKLRNKRMNGKIYEGNILIDSKGRYNKYDKGKHKNKFKKIKNKYVIADMKHSRKLEKNEIIEKSKNFVNKISDIFNKKGKTVYDILSRKGRKMDELQINKILQWLNS